TAVDDHFINPVGRGQTRDGLPVLENDTDPDNDSLTIARIVSYDPNQGTPVVSADHQTISFTASYTFVGTASFVYEISDGHGHTSTATVSIPVVFNDPPIARDDGYEQPILLAPG